MTVNANDTTEARVHAYRVLPRDVAVARFPELATVYAVEMELANEARSAGAASEAVVEHVIDALRTRLSQTLSKREDIHLSGELRDDVRWQVAFRNLHEAVAARLADRRATLALTAAHRQLLIERAEALRAHDRQRPDDVDDGVDTFRALEVAMSLALLDYPANTAPFTDAELQAAYERHLTGVAPTRLGTATRA